MNHADRQRLSQLLELIDEYDVWDADADGTGYYLMLAEARAIVDAPAEPQQDSERIAAGILHINGKAIIINDSANIAADIKAHFANQAPNKTLDAFLSEPIHEYRDRVQARRRHRALSPLRLATILTLAAVALVCLTATSQTWGGTETHIDDAKPSEGPSEAAQSPFRPGAAPYIPAHRPGTPGNGLGVVAP